MEVTVREETRGRKQKITAADVYDYMSDAMTATKKEIADELEVCPATVSSRLRELRENGTGIFFDEKGLFLLEKIKNEKDLEKINNYQIQIIKTVSGLANCGIPAKKMMLEASKVIRNSLSKEERASLTSYMTALSNLLTYTSIAENIDEA